MFDKDREDQKAKEREKDESDKESIRKRQECMKRRIMLALKNICRKN